MPGAPSQATLTIQSGPGAGRVIELPEGELIIGRIDPAGLVMFIQSERGAKLRPDHKVVLIRDWPEPEDRLKGVLHASLRLAEIATKAKARIVKKA